MESQSKHGQSERKRRVSSVPNVRSSIVTKDEISIVGSDGRTFSVTRAQIVAFWQAQGGSAAARKTATVNWVKTNMQTALGPEQVPVALMTFDFNATDNAVAMLLELLSG
jgi:hypothetical protein